MGCRARIPIQTVLRPLSREALHLSPHSKVTCYSSTPRISLSLRSQVGEGRCRPFSHPTHFTHSQQLSQIRLSQAHFKPLLPDSLSITPCRITRNGILNHAFGLFVNQGRMVVYATSVTQPKALGFQITVSTEKCSHDRCIRKETDDSEATSLRLPSRYSDVKTAQ